MAPSVEGAKSKLNAAGKEVGDERYPFAVALGERSGVAEKFASFCTASIVNDPSISERPFLLTAAHCTHDDDLAKKLVVATGPKMNRTLTLSEVKVIRHPNYLTGNRADVRFDIAVILAGGLPSTGGIKLIPDDFALGPAELTAEDQTAYEKLVVDIVKSAATASKQGQTSVDFQAPRSLMQKLPSVTVAGFGITNEVATSSGTEQTSDGDILRETSLRILTLSNITKDSDLTILADDPEEGVCSGDSGGPVFARSADGFVQVGVVSFGRNPCKGTEHAPTNVLRFKAWLRSAVGGKTGDDDSKLDGGHDAGTTGGSDSDDGGAGSDLAD